MSGRDGLQDEMRRLLLGELGSGPLAIDQDTADRLLAGRLDPADAPPGYAEVAKVLAAAAAPAFPHELDGDAAATAAFERERLDRRGADSHAAPRRRPRRGTRLAVVAVAVAVLMVGGVAAAATGTLPGPAQRLVDSVSRDAHPHRPATPVTQPDAGGARSSAHDQRLEAGGGHHGGHPVGGHSSSGHSTGGGQAFGGGHQSGHSGSGHDPVGRGSPGQGATGKVSQGADAPTASSGGAHGKGSTVSHPAHAPAGSGRAEGHRKEKGE